MADLSMMESLKDKMSRVGGNAFAEYVDDATSELQLTLDPDKVAQLVHFGNQGGEHVVTLLNAVRRRIDHKKVRVQLYTVQVLDALVRRCGRDLHRELATQKGLLRDLVLLAAKTPASEGDFEVHKAAASLVLNCSYWFAEHPDAKVVEGLAQLANHARVAGASFDGVAADRDFRPRMDLIDPAVAAASINTDGGAPPTRQRPHQPSRASRQRAAQQRQQQQQQQQERARAQAQQRRPVIVDAIPIKAPPEERLAGMMEAVILMGDLMTQAEAQAAEQGGVPVARNEAVNTVAATVRDDHELLSSLLGTGVPMDGRDTVQSISDSQVTVLERHTELLIASGAITEPHGASAAAADDGDEARAIAASLADAGRPAGAPAAPTSGATGGNTDIVEPTSAADSVSPQAPQLGTYRERITRYYEFYNPEKLGDVARVLEKFAGREEIMMRNLRAKYGEEPMPPQGSAATAPPAAPPAPAAERSTATALADAGAAPTPAASTGVPGSGRSRQHPELGTYRERVARFFEFYAPDQMSTLDVLLESNAGVEDDLLAQLRAQYGDEPMPSASASPTTATSPPAANPPPPAPSASPPLATATVVPAAEATDDADDVPTGDSYRDRLVRFYRFYNPEKLRDVDLVLSKFAGREEAMIRQLKAKYGDEPPKPAPKPKAQPAEAAAPAPAAPAAAAAPSIDALFDSAQQASYAPAVSASSSSVAPPSSQSQPSPSRAASSQQQAHFDPFADIPDPAPVAAVVAAPSPPLADGSPAAAAPPAEPTPETVHAAAPPPPPPGPPVDAPPMAYEYSPAEATSPVEREAAPDATSDAQEPPLVRAEATTASIDAEAPQHREETAIPAHEAAEVAEAPVESSAYDEVQAPAAAEVPAGEAPAAEPPAAEAEAPRAEEPATEEPAAAEAPSAEEPAAAEADHIEGLDSEPEGEDAPAPAGEAEPTHAAKADSLLLADDAGEPEAPPPAEEATAAAPPARTAAFPAPSQSVDPAAPVQESMTHEDAPAAAAEEAEAPEEPKPQPKASAKKPAKKAAEDDDFEAFLNNRLTK